MDEGFAGLGEYQTGQSKIKCDGNRYTKSAGFHETSKIKKSEFQLA
jgi:hypothetical protein